MMLSEIQKEIVDTPGNMIVSASAGTGKTHTLVSKIEKEILDNHSHKVIAAITFTIKAAKEIRNRLKVSDSEHFIGTNNRFVLDEIIKPFARDVWGEEYNTDMSTDYSIRKNDFSECLQYLKNKHIIISYKDSKKNFIFELAMYILKHSEACRLFLKAKYFKVYVDEYQDSDRTMHDFFMYLCKELRIEMFVVGDEKQSIYIWRGAYPDAFKSLLRDPLFQNKELYANYRSCQMIQNYSNLLDDKTSEMYKKDTNTEAVVVLRTNRDNWNSDVLPFIDLKKETAFLRYSNDDAKLGADLLSESGTDFTYIPRTPISEITTDVSWLYNAIAQYFIIEKYSVYDFIDEIPEESIGNRKILSYIQTKLYIIKNALDENDNQKIIDVTQEIASYFGYLSSEIHINSMIKTIREEQYHSAFYLNELTHVSITFHASKGLEYDQVIIFAEDYPLDKPESVYNHYVAVTRAKSKLIIVVTNPMTQEEKSWIKRIRENFRKNKIKLRDVMTIIEQ